MSTPSPQPATLTSLPSLDDLPRTECRRVRPDAVREAFDAFRRHAVQLQAQLRVLQAAGKGANLEPTGHAVRMDALHLIRAAAEFADVLERDAQNATAAQIQRTEVEVTRRQRELQEREREIERYREESERQRDEIVNAAKSESREISRHHEPRRDRRAARGRGPRRPAARAGAPPGDRADELGARRGRADARLGAQPRRLRCSRARSRAPSSCSTAAGLGAEALAEVSDAIVAAARAETDAGRRPSPRRRKRQRRRPAVPEADGRAEPAEPTSAEAEPDEAARVAGRRAAGRLAPTTSRTTTRPSEAGRDDRASRLTVSARGALPGRIRLLL